ncbi:MAG: hypothetical protein FWE67_03245, partial [Planctomycetaceae bacterium]|nr:hypothetical protein [Planctomycetaceae bacterium]
FQNMHFPRRIVGETLEPFTIPAPTRDFIFAKFFRKVKRGQKFAKEQRFVEPSAKLPSPDSGTFCPCQHSQRCYHLLFIRNSIEKIHQHGKIRY